MEELISDLETRINWNGILLVDFQDSNLNDDHAFEDAMRLLSFKDQTKVLRKRMTASRHSSLSNALLQLLGCSITSGALPSQLRVGYGLYGKPYLDNDRTVTFSMSNGNRYVTQYLARVKVGNFEVGVDIASKDDYVDEHDVDTFRGIFSHEEYERLNACRNDNERRSLFSYYWSLKESYTKLTGTGLNCDLSSIDFGKLDVLKAPTLLQRTIDKQIVTFYSQWLNPQNVEVLTVCHRSDLAVCVELQMAPKLYQVAFDDLIKYLKNNSIK